MVVVNIVPKQGQVLYCFKCDHDLLRFKRDVKPGESPSNELVEPIGEQGYPLAGTQPTCSHCGDYIHLNAIRWPKGDERNGAS